ARPLRADAAPVPAGTRGAGGHVPVPAGRADRRAGGPREPVVMNAPDRAPDRLSAVLAAIDAANADDPHTIVVDGVERPKELAHAELMTDWVRRLAPGCSEAQLIAARAHHLRRWAIPRRDYPEGRAGYLRWRTALRRRHAADVAELMEGAGYGPDEIERVQAIMSKRGLGRDAEAQVHEDALCLVFLETQLDDLVARIDDDGKVVDILRKTAAKMSPAGLEAAAGLRLSPAGSRLLAEALGSAA